MTEDTPIEDKPKHAGGRPSSLTPEVYETARDYLENYKSKYDQVIPSIAGLAVSINISRSRVYEWVDENSPVYNEEFKDIVEKCLSNQEVTLTNMGLSGDFNASITKLLLTKHGYHDKQDVDQTTSVNLTIESKDADCA